MNAFPFPPYFPLTEALPSSSNRPIRPLPRRASCELHAGNKPLLFPPLVDNPSTPPLRLRGGAGGRPRRAVNKDKAAAAPAKIRRLEVPNTMRVKTRSSRASPLTDLDKLKIEETEVRTEVARLNLALRDVEGDGNCLFRAVSDQLLGDQKSHPEMRKLTCDYLEAHEDEMGYWAAFCFNEGEDYALYVKRMRKSGQYASEVEVHAVARMLKRDIRIIHKDHSDTITWIFDPSSIPSASPAPEATDRSAEQAHDAPSTPRPRRRTRSSTINLLQTPAAPPPSSPLYASALEQYLPPVREGRSMLWLALFNDAEHYQSVRRKGDRERAPAEVEDRMAIPHAKDRSEAARIARGEIPVPAASSSKGSPTNISLVLASLPAGHAFSADYVAGILARVKGDIGAAVEILLEELDTLSDITEGTDSDGKVEQMLLDPPPEEASVVEHAPPPGVNSYRDPSSATITTAHPSRPDSPSGSSTTTVSASHSSESDDVSHSSVATTPSSSSLRSTRSKRSTSSGSKKAAKPYDRPTLPGRRKGKELSKELEELKMGASNARETRIESERRRSIEEQGERRKSSLEDLKAARERLKAKA